MKVAAAKALAGLAKEDVPDSVLKAYGIEKLKFGPDYLIPKPFDPRVLIWETVAVAKAACETGVARKVITDWDAYKNQLEELLGAEREMFRRLVNKARQKPKRIVFAEGNDEKVLRAAQIIHDEKIGTPVLLGNEKIVRNKVEKLGLKIDNIEIIQPEKSPLFKEYVAKYYKRRCRKGVNLEEAKQHIMQPMYFGPMMVREGAGDVYIAGRTRHYPSAIRPMLRVLKDRLTERRIAAVVMVLVDHKIFFLADTAVNIDPETNVIVDIAEDVHELVSQMGIQPRMALLSFSNFGSAPYESTKKMHQAAKVLWDRHPKWMVDGEMQADTAVVQEIVKNDYPFSRLQGGANCLIFPNLSSANISYKLLKHLGGATIIGPILTGLELPMHILQRGVKVDDIVNIASIGAIQAE